MVINKFRKFSYPWTKSVPHSFAGNSKKLLTFLHSCPDGEVNSILDFGCGNGYMTNFLDISGYDVMGIDDSLEAIKCASELFPSITFRQMSIYDVKDNCFKNKFDAIICVEVIAHLYDPAIVFQSSKNILKENSRLIIITPYHGYLKNLLMAIFNLWPKHLSPNWLGGVIKFFDLNSISKLAQENGFSIIEISTIGRCKPVAKNIFLVCTPSKIS